MDELKKYKLIESNFNIVLKKGSFKKVENLTPLLITQSKDIFFSEIILFVVKKGNFLIFFYPF